MSDLPTYVTLRTIADDGTLITDRPTAERIEGRFEPTPGMARYADALALAHEIRNAGDGWAIALDEADLGLYEPTAPEPVYIVDPSVSGGPLRFDSEGLALAYLTEHPSAGVIETAQVERSFR